MFNVFHIELLCYCYLYKWENFFIAVIYCFYLFSVLWLTKVVIILFNDYNVIVKCFILNRFMEYIILLLNLLVNVLQRLYFVNDTNVLF